MAIRGITNRKATSSNRAPSTSSLFAFTSHHIELSIATIVSVDHPSTSLYYYLVARSLYRDKWTTMICLWWLSQWLVTYGFIHLCTCGAIYLPPQYVDATVNIHNPLTALLCFGTTPKTVFTVAITGVYDSSSNTSDFYLSWKIDLDDFVDELDSRHANRRI